MAMPTGARRIRGRRDLRLAVVGRETVETVFLNASHHAETMQNSFLLRLQGATAHRVARHLPDRLSAFDP
jgi:hypothetical protein